VGAELQHAVCAVCGVAARPEDGARKLVVRGRVLLFCGPHAEAIRTTVTSGASHLARRGLEQLTVRHPILGTIARAFGRELLPGLLDTPGADPHRKAGL